METDAYLSLRGRSEGLFKTKGSKHFSYAIPVQTELDVKNFIASLRIEHSDAGHFCYAYRLGHDGSRYRANDDGEPNNSAGQPILGVLKSNNLTNSLIIVVRYFGGTKLGIGGLIEAYREAANDAVIHGEIVEKFRENKLKISYPYAQMGAVMNVLKRLNIKPFNTDFQNTCSLEINIRLSKFDFVFQQLTKISEVETEVVYEG